MLVIMLILSLDIIGQFLTIEYYSLLIFIYQIIYQKTLANKTMKKQRNYFRIMRNIGLCSFIISPILGYLYV